MKKIQALALLLALLFTASCSLAEGAEDPVIIKIGETTIPLSEVNSLLDEMYVYYEVTESDLSDSDFEYLRDEAITMLVHEAILNLKIKEYGLEELTEEQQAQSRAEFDELYQEAIDEYVAYFISMGSTEEEAMESLEATGYNKEDDYALYLADYAYLLLYEQIYEGLEVGDEAIQQEYDALVEAHKSVVENDIASYEMYKHFYGYEIYFMPEGYRQVKQILLDYPAQISADLADLDTDITAVSASITELTDELSALEVTPEEGEEAPETEPRSAEEIEADLAAKQEELSALEAERQALQDRILPEMEEELAAITAKLEAGESIDDLIQEYSRNKPEAGVDDSIMVHHDTLMETEEFTSQAMALKAIGDFTDAFITSTGVHIVYYVADVEGGPLPMTEDVKLALEESLLTAVQEAAYDEQISLWMEEYDAEIHAELVVRADTDPAETTEEPAEDAEEEAEAVEAAPAG